MKNKYVKYGLFIVVALIWGKILVSYFGIFNNSEEMDYVPQEIVQPIKVTNISKEYKLNLDYKDPFLNQSSAFVQVKAINPSISKQIIKKAPSVIAKEPKVVYKGLVKNKNSSKKTGLVIVDGKSHLVTNNSQLESIRIIGFDEDECRYNFNGKIKTVSK